MDPAVAETEISPLESVRKRSGAPVASDRGSARIRRNRETRAVSAQIDLHGLTVEEALDRIEQALSEALLADLSELRADSRSERRTYPCRPAPSITRIFQRP